MTEFYTFIYEVDYKADEKSDATKTKVTHCVAADRLNSIFFVEIEKRAHVKVDDLGTLFVPCGDSDQFVAMMDSMNSTGLFMAPATEKPRIQTR